jgi:biotin carboxylase
MRILLLAQWNWHGPARIPKALKQAGCEVAAVCKKGDWTSLTRFVDQRFLTDTSDEAAILAVLDRVIREWQPDLILPGTDNMVSTLEKYRRVLSPHLPENLRQVVNSSLYDQAKESLVGGKIDFLNALAERGVSVAPQREVVTFGDADTFIQQHGYPVVLKPDEGFGGSGIKFCNSEDELLPELERILFAPTRRRHAIQKHLGTRTALIEFVAKDGKLLAANSVLRLRTHPGDTGPTSVARMVKGATMRRAAEEMCELLGYNGIGVAQFMVEDESCEPAYLIELNPRMSSFIHLWKLIGTDLVATLVNAWQGRRFSVEPVKEGLTVALYPQEALRDKDSEFLQALRDHVDDDPALAAEYEQMIAKQRVEVLA